MASKAIDGAVTGAKAVLTTPKGWGTFAGVFIALAALIYFGFGPDRAASELRSRTG